MYCRLRQSRGLFYKEVAVHDLGVVCRVAVGTVSDETAGPEPPAVASSVSMLGWITRGGGKRALLVFASTDALCRASQATLDQDRACNDALVHIDATTHHRALSKRSRRSCDAPLTRLAQKPRVSSATRRGCRKKILRLNCEQNRKATSLVIRQQ
jgi:hypothetical protein